MCTRFPIQISFRQTSAAKELPVKATVVPGPLSEEDDELLARVEDFLIEKKELTSEVMEEIIDKVSACGFGRSCFANACRQRNVSSVTKSPPNS